MPNSLRNWYHSDHRPVLRREVRWAGRWLRSRWGVGLILFAVFAKLFVVLGQNYIYPTHIYPYFPATRQLPPMLNHIWTIMGSVDFFLPPIVWLYYFHVRVLGFMSIQIKSDELRLSLVAPRMIWPANCVGPLILFVALWLSGRLTESIHTEWIHTLESKIAGFSRVHRGFTYVISNGGWWWYFHLRNTFFFLGHMAAIVYGVLFVSVFTALRVFRRPTLLHAILWMTSLLIFPVAVIFLSFMLTPWSFNIFNWFWLSHKTPWELLSGDLWNHFKPVLIALIISIPLYYLTLHRLRKRGIPGSLLERPSKEMVE